MFDGVPNTPKNFQESTRDNDLFHKKGRHTVCNTTNITKRLRHRYFNGKFFEAAILQNSVTGTSGQITQPVFSWSKSIIKTVGGVKPVLC